MRKSLELGELIHESENNKIEFKHYRYPFNDYLKDTLIKTICGFLNSEGGRLYIGFFLNFKIIALNNV